MAMDKNWDYSRNGGTMARDRHDKVQMAEGDYPDEMEPMAAGGPTGKGDLEDLKGILAGKFGIELPDDVTEKSLVRDLCVALTAHGGTNGASDQGGPPMQMAHRRRMGHHARGTARQLAYAARPEPITPERARQASEEQLRNSGLV
jgi:hypothetical protein